MIDLTPIARKIQQRLFEKSTILSRAGDPNVPLGGLTHDKLASKTVWFRMTSGAVKPVTIQGGELLSDRSTAAGLDQLYPNKNRRPIAGLKNLEVGFLGGVRALRQATVNWTCWSFEEIDRLTPHFLQLGKTVMVEWGWVYDKKSLVNLPSFLTSDGRIKTTAYTDYRDTVINANGDFDMMVGIVKNMEFNSREDGGFDCTTTLSGMGASILSNPEPSKDQINTSVNLKLSDKDRPEDIAAKLNKANVTNSVDDLETLGFTLTPKIFIKFIDNYLRDKLATPNSKKLASQVRHTQEKYKKYNIPYKDHPRSGNRRLIYLPNQFIIIAQAGGLSGDFAIRKVENAWVQWGWFEDNILSKFTTLVSDKSDDSTPITEYRSVEKIITADGTEARVDDSPLYESVRIKNHPRFQTIDINNHILPCKFSPLEKPKGSSSVIKGDVNSLHTLAKIVNQNFDSFNPPTTIQESITYEVKPGDILGNIAQKYGASVDDIASSNNLKSPNNISVGQNLIIPGKQSKNEMDENTGYLRNMLINTKVLKQAFGVDENDQFSGEASSISEALNNMFEILNQDMGFWSYQIKNDEVDTYRSKIIDGNVTTPLPDTKIKIDNGRANEITTRSVYEGGEIKHLGVFYFPTWRKDSFVKSQNLSASVPNAMAMSIMYGANSDKLSTVGTAGEEVGDKTANAVAQVGSDPKSVEDKDEKLDNIKIALKKEGYETYGSKKTDQPLTKKGGDDDLGAWAANNKDTLVDQKELRAQKSANLKAMKDVNETSTTVNDTEVTLDDVVDPGVPPPLPDFLVKDFPNAFSLLGEPTGQSEAGQKPHPLSSLYSSKYDEKGRMKQQFIDSISFNTALVKTTKKTKTTDTDEPLLLPLDMELSIDGIGGIYPGNSYHSFYLPKRYREECIFQAFDINHTVDPSGWTTTISGKMRTTLNRVSGVTIEESIVPIESIKDQFMKNYLGKEEFEDEENKEILQKVGAGNKQKAILANNKQMQDTDPETYNSLLYAQRLLAKGAGLSEQEINNINNLEQTPADKVSSTELGSKAAAYVNNNPREGLEAEAIGTLED